MISGYSITETSTDDGIGRRSAARKRLLAQRIVEVGRNEYQAKADEKRFGELFESYDKAHLVVNVRPTTRDDETGCIRLHLLPYFADLSIRRVTPAMVEAWRSGMLEKVLVAIRLTRPIAYSARCSATRYDTAG